MYGEGADEIDFSGVGKRTARHHPHVSERGEKFGHRIEQLEPSLFVERHEGDTDNRFGHRINSKDGIGHEPCMLFAIQPTDLLEVDDPTAPGKHGAQPRKTMVIDIRLHGGLDAGKTFRTKPREFG
jgi:hypothetical protein